MELKKYKYRSGLPMWQGGGYEILTAYKSVQKETHHNLECEVIYYSVDGKNISSIDIKVQAIYKSIKVDSKSDVGCNVKNLFMEYIEKVDDSYAEKYCSAKAKHDDILDLFCEAIDVNQKCEQYFSAMIWFDFKTIIA